MSPVPHVKPEPPAPDPAALHVRITNAQGKLISDEWLLPGEFDVIAVDPATWYVNHVYDNGTHMVTVKGVTG